mmetsp:Transcript_86185/g.230150  ORF Transcript_86185/g.230150 Transcript_86185/m.230150 type:complete len:213 (+) Transcript_86185:1670-2308(+)
MRRRRSRTLGRRQRRMTRRGGGRAWSGGPAREAATWASRRGRPCFAEASTLLVAKFSRYRTANDVPTRTPWTSAVGTGTTSDRRRVSSLACSSSPRRHFSLLRIRSASPSNQRCLPCPCPPRGNTDMGAPTAPPRRAPTAAPWLRPAGSTSMTTACTLLPRGSSPVMRSPGEGAGSIRGPSRKRMRPPCLAALKKRAAMTPMARTLKTRGAR